VTIAPDAKRDFKDRLYAEFARIGKAIASPHRLEILEILAQGERTVESLAAETGLSVANASRHLQQLRQAQLVIARREAWCSPCVIPPSGTSPRWTVWCATSSAIATVSNP
jgi:predicted Rossmann fold nucleotide-binding protein DprA/Smf involved in DNA uptake